MNKTFLQVSRSADKTETVQNPTKTLYGVSIFRIDSEPVIQYSLNERKENANQNLDLRSRHTLRKTASLSIFDKTHADWRIKQGQLELDMQKQRSQPKIPFILQKKREEQNASINKGSNSNELTAITEHTQSEFYKTKSRLVPNEQKS